MCARLLLAEQRDGLAQLAQQPTHIGIRGRHHCRPHAPPQVHLPQRLLLQYLRVPAALRAQGANGTKPLGRSLTYDGVQTSTIYLVPMHEPDTSLIGTRPFACMRIAHGKLCLAWQHGCLKSMAYRWQGQRLIIVDWPAHKASSLHGRPTAAGFLRLTQLR